MNGTLYGVLAVLITAVSLIPALKWIRIAQREQYNTGRIKVFYRLWYFGSGWSVLGLIVGTLAFVSLCVPTVGRSGHLAAMVVLGACSWLTPVGLRLRGKTSKLVLTARAKRLIVAFALLVAVAAALGSLFGFGLALAGLGVLASAWVIELALIILSPYEDHRMDAFVEQARATLARIHPWTVGITGSYGKTTTKGYIDTLVSGTFRTVASPKSFNNRGGLTRTINEYLVPGTEVLVAEMGTFGPGTIARLVKWCPPDIAVLTALGPVHLERFGSEAAILRAKLEIVTPTTKTVVINVDIPRLSLASNVLETQGKKVVRVSATSLGADVCAKLTDDGFIAVYLAAEPIGRVSVGDLVPSNLACAVAVATELGVHPNDIAERLGMIKPQPNRLVSELVPASGVEILDDTYNSNPAGARRALDILGSRGGAGARRIVVTPGMVELGKRQFGENFRFGRDCALVANFLVVVGRTNRKALVAGANEGKSVAEGVLEEIVVVKDRAEALAWVSSHGASGDVVLYENDLPDNYP